MNLSKIILIGTTALNTNLSILYWNDRFCKIMESEISTN